MEEPNSVCVCVAVVSPSFGSFSERVLISGRVLRAYGLRDENMYKGVLRFDT